MAYFSIIVATVVVQDGKLLLVQEGKEIALGKWNVSSGHVEVRENIVNAAKREFKEETGLDAAIQGIIAIESYGGREDSQVVKFIFKGELLSNQEPRVDGKEILAVKWFTFEEIKQMKEQLRNQKTMENILARLAKHEIYSLDILKDYL
jgi:ADP-ribose pyrophosphatase YjhB (NUDIX family)